MQEQIQWREVIRLESSPEAPRWSRRAVQPELVESGLSSDDVEALKVAVGEVVTNALEHDVRNPSDCITISVRRQHEQIQISVHSPQNGWASPDETITVPYGQYDASHLPFLRLHLIRALVDTITIYKDAVDGTLVVLTKRLSPARA